MGKIPEIGIETGQTIQADHVLNLTNALRAEEAYDICMSGSANVTGSFTVSETGSFGFLDLGTTTISSASHADYADTTGTVLSASHAIFADTAGTVISASHAVQSDSSLTALVAGSVVSASHALNSDNADSVVSSSHALRANVAINVEGSITSASFADYSMSGSHALIADNVNGSITSASFATYANNAGNSDSANTSTSASHAIKANTADTYSGAVTSASFSDTAMTSSYAHFATSASVEVTHELSSSFSDTSLSSSFSLYSNAAGTSDSATSASSADWAVSSSYAENLKSNDNLSFELKMFEGTILNFMTYEYTGSDYIQKISYYSSNGGSLMYEQQFTLSLDLIQTESIVRQSDGLKQTMAYGYSASVVTSKEIVNE